MLSIRSRDSDLPVHRLRRRHRRPRARSRSSKQTSAEAVDGPRLPIVTIEPWALLVVFEAASRAFEDYRDMGGRIGFANHESRNGSVIMDLFGMFARRRAKDYALQGKSWRPSPTRPTPKVSSGSFHLLHYIQTSTTSALPIEAPGSPSRPSLAITRLPELSPMWLQCSVAANDINTIYSIVPANHHSLLSNISCRLETHDIAGLSYHCVIA
jgi:hypothetical protein